MHTLNDKKRLLVGLVAAAAAAVELTLLVT